MKSKRKYILIVLVILLAIRIAMQYISFEYNYKSDTKYVRYTLKIVDVQKETKTNSSYIAKICKVGKCNDKVVLNVYENKLEINIGDTVGVIGKLIIPEVLNNPGEFNYKRYLNSKGIYATITAKSVEKVEKVEKHFSIRKEISKKVQNTLPKKYGTLLTSMLYGDDTYLDETIGKDFKTIGIGHIISVSGTNIAVIISVLDVIIKRLRVGKSLKLILQIFLVICFNIIANAQYAILRACICFCLGAICNLFNIKIKGPYLLGMSLYLILLINPYCIFNTSLQLSYSATLGIMLFSKKISKYLIKKIRLKKNGRKKVYVMLRKCTSSAIQIISLTISAQIFSLPIQITAFNFLSSTQLLSNVLLSFFITSILVIGTIGMCIFFVPVISSAVFYITYPFLVVIVALSKVLAKITPNLGIPAQPPFIWCIYYLMILTCLLLDKFILKKIKIGKMYIQKRTIIKMVMATVFIICVAVTNIYIIYLDNYMYFFNVGQGNMCFIRINGQNIVIDCGSTKSSVAYNVLDSYLTLMNIKNIDIVALTHFHVDHANAMCKLIENYNVKSICYTTPNIENMLYKEIIKSVESKKIKKYIMYEKDSIKLDKIEIKVLFPTKNIAGNKDLDLNTTSTVYLVKVKDKNYLFMGDSGILAERYIMKNKLSSSVYLLMVGHHGSKTSTSEDFVSYLNPKVSIISSKKSVYGHPADSVLEILKKSNTKILVTENLGAIKIKI